MEQFVGERPDIGHEYLAESLSQFGEFDDQTLDHLSNLLSADCALSELNKQSHEQIRLNRREFFEIIGLSESAGQLDHLPLLATFIETQLVFNEAGLDAAKVINAHPTTIRYAPEGVREKVENLQSLGLDAGQIVNAFPATIGYAPESVRAKVENLQSLGLDAGQIVNAFPATISYAPESVRAKVENLQSLGLDAAKVINAHPTTIRYAPEGVREKVENLQSLGLDAGQIVNAAPTTIGLAPESVRAKVENLQSLGLDAVKIVNAAPTTIGLAPESVRIKFYALMRFGLITPEQPLDCADSGLIRALFTIPNESLIAYLGSQEYSSNQDLRTVVTNSIKYAKLHLGNNSSERRQSYIERMPELIKSVGYVAVMNAMRLKVDPFAAAPVY